MNLFIGIKLENIFILNQTESHHLSKVLRLRINQEVLVTQGNGILFLGKIKNTNHKKAEIEIIKELKNTQKRNYTIRMAVAPTKQIDRTEWFLEKSVEVGLDEYFPILSFHSERRKINNERLERIAFSAVKQSQKAELITINKLIRFEEFISQDFKGQKFIAHCYDGYKTLINKAINLENDYTFLIGPEGDFSKEEVELAKHHGFEAISLGNQRLRTETAALACVMQVHFAHL